MNPAVYEPAHSQPHTALAQLPAAPATPRPSKLDVHEGRIKELLGSYPSITAQRVFEELRAAGYQGGYSIKETSEAMIRVAMIGLMLRRLATGAFLNTVSDAPPLGAGPSRSIEVTLPRKRQPLSGRG